ncbi:MAG: FHA domain-containing protein [Ketobacteraceae bacterium]|nr:FHA domain-containing protein [Ketobacteraceae bacterium]
MQAEIIEHPSRALSSACCQRGSGPRLVACSSIIRGKVIGLQTGRWLPFVIGAGEHCDFIIKGSTMQASHVGVEELDNQWVLSVLDDRADVWVNNEPVKVAVLEHGDQVQLGRHLLMFLDNENDDALSVKSRIHGVFSLRRR